MRIIKNSDIKLIKSLNKTKNRSELNIFFIEGKRLVESAVLCKADIKNIYSTEKFLHNNVSFKELIQEQNLKYTKVSNKDFLKISNTKNPSGIAAVCGTIINTNKNTKNTKILYLSDISDPGNLGTIIRSAAYFNFTNILLSKNCADPYNPKVLRSGMGAHFKVNISPNVELEKLKEDYTLIGADQKGKNFCKVNFPKKYILVLGNEAHGIEKRLLNILDMTISIKKTGFGESLNVSAAASILMNYLSEK